MMSRFNDRLAAWITRGVSTMWCAYAFAILACLSLPSVLASGNLQLIVAWVAQTFLQLVLLSIIMVGQRVLGDGHDDLHDKVDHIIKHSPDIPDL